MSLDALFPFSGDHAVQNAVFALDFNEAIEASALTNIQRACTSAYASELPVVQEQQVVSFAMGPGAPPMRAKPQPGGFVMQRMAGLPPVPIRAVTVSQQNCTIVINDYTRWAKALEDVNRYLGPVLDIVGKDRSISSIGLQYTDVFLWRADPKALIVSEVFAVGNPYLVPHVLQTDGPLLWHSHHGFFATMIAPPNHYQRLDNINVSRVETDGRHSLQILTSHKAQFATPVWNSDSTNRQVITNVFDQLHGANKDLLRQLLTDSVRSKIKLDL